MGTTSEGGRPKLATHSVIHVEVAYAREGKDTAWQVLVSRPGVERMWTETWLGRDGIIDEIILAKILKAVEDHVFHAIHVTGGVQMRMGAID